MMTRVLILTLFVTWFSVIFLVNGSNILDFLVTGESCSWFPNAKRCGNYAMDFYTYRRCSLGRKSVICRKRIVGNTNVDSRDNILRVVSYNVRELPHLVKRKGERERTCRIPEALVARFPYVDIVVFQELFFKGCIEGEAEVSKLLRPFGFSWTYQPLDDDVGFPKFVGAGVMIASKWPIVKQDKVTYRNAKTISSDILGKKGCVYTAVQKGTFRYHIFGTHLQSGYGEETQRVRSAQAQEIRNFERKQNIPIDEAVLYIGDFNEDLVGHPEIVQGLLQKLDAYLPNITGPHIYTYDRRNALAEKTDPDGWLDYIAMSKTHRRPKTANMTAVDLENAVPFTYCSLSPLILKYVPPSSRKCLQTKTTRELSDHYAVFGYLRY